MRICAQVAPQAKLSDSRSSWRKSQETSIVLHADVSFTIEFSGDNSVGLCFSFQQSSYSAHVEGSMFFMCMPAYTQAAKLYLHCS